MGCSCKAGHERQPPPLRGARPSTTTSSAASALTSFGMPGPSAPRATCTATSASTNGSPPPHPPAPRRSARRAAARCSWPAAAWSTAWSGSCGSGAHGAPRWVAAPSGSGPATLSATRRRQQWGRRQMLQRRWTLLLADGRARFQNSRLTPMSARSSLCPARILAAKKACDAARWRATMRHARIASRFAGTQAAASWCSPPSSASTRRRASTEPTPADTAACVG